MYMYYMALSLSVWTSKSPHSLGDFSRYTESCLKYRGVRLFDGLNYYLPKGTGPF